MDFFLLKKIISSALMPLSLVLILLLLALVFNNRRPTLSVRCLFAGTMLLLCGSLAPIADRLMYPIENNFPAWQDNRKALDYIVVLGCNHTSDDTLPATSQLEACSLQRMVEALRIYHRHPEASIITSGAAFTEARSNAETVKMALVSLGVPDNKIIPENFPQDTEEEAQLIAPRISGSNSVLITNADHMPRALLYFQRYGANPTPAPAGNWVKGMAQAKGWGYYVPKPHKFEQTTYAWYESLGRLFQWLKGLL